MNEPRLHPISGRWPQQVILDAGRLLSAEHRSQIPRDRSCLQASEHCVCCIERRVTAVGVLVAACALLSLALVGVAAISPDDFLWLWAALTLALSPLTVFVHRSLAPLFWQS